MGKIRIQKWFESATGRTKHVFMGLLLLFAGFSPVSVFAEEPAAPAPVKMDQLLTLPKGFDAESERRGGLTRVEWLARFASAEQALVSAKEALAKSQKAMEEAAVADAWKVAPPGMPTNAEGTANYQLRQEIKRNRGEVARAEKHLRNVEIEANLAEVPDTWRHSEVSGAPAAASASDAPIQP